MSTEEISIHSTYGSAFIGLVVSAVLYGITILQTYLYYRNYPRDPRYLKILVLLVWLWDTLHLALCTTAVYWYLISNFNNVPALKQLTWSMELQTDCNGIVGLLVQCFFAKRVWSMSQNIFLVSIIVFLATIHFALGIVFTVYSFRFSTVDGFAKLIWVTSAGIGSAAAADVLIAASLCYYLSKSRTGFKRTDSLIHTLIIYSLTTGLMTSLIDVVIIISFATMPQNYVWLAFFWIVGRCYVNSFLAALNSRESLRERVAAREASLLQLSPLTTGNINATDISKSDRLQTQASTIYRSVSDLSKPPLAVSIRTDTVYKSDYPESPTSGTSTAPPILCTMG
ncbi:hypothetical protein PM082_017533 [Marasmius tenuissimus]|nr:hypothetical protein PM082_017533 [Marasmius tenuissimus]